jgi:hypothetical protein
MKKWVVLIIACLFTNILSQTNISPQFSELKGMEDQLGNTHLFYRIYTYYENPPVYNWSNHIFHFELGTEIDTLYISSSGHEDPAYNFSKWVSDVDYWNHNPAEFIFSGGYSMGPFFEGSAFVERFDGYYNTIDYFWGSADYLDISPTNDSILYLGVNAYGGFQTLASSNGGKSWDTLNLDYQFLSLYPTNENIYFVENEDRELFRTTDSGNTFNLVDPEFLPDTRLFYDPDQHHIYRKANNKLIVSDNLGEQFSWETVFTKTTTDPFYFSNDISLTGSVFISEGENIFYSSDYGDNFSLYKTLDRKIVGIYKKPNSNQFYAATKYKIYEITSDTIQVIKILSIPEDALKYYPLEIGDRWVYDKYTYIEWNTYHDIFTREVMCDTILSNGNKYFQIDEHDYSFPNINTNYERIDSSDGLIYRYDNSLGLPDDEYLIDDLLAAIGDTIFSFRFGYPWEDGYTVFAEESTFKKWGLNKPKKIFEQYDFMMPRYSLTQDIGMDSLTYSFDFGYTEAYLKGCVIDDVVFGDTTIVSVEDEENPIASSFKLEQNYPNPFNPTTNIGFRIADFGFVSLKVYDVLGNEIVTLVNEELFAGEYEVEFNSHSVKGRNLTSGIYFYQIQSGNFVGTKKMILLK